MHSASCFPYKLKESGALCPSFASALLCRSKPAVSRMGGDWGPLIHGEYVQLDNLAQQHTRYAATGRLPEANTNPSRGPALGLMLLQLLLHLLAGTAPANATAAADTKDQTAAGEGEVAAKSIGIRLRQQQQLMLGTAVVAQ
ncbi:hypothetical protein EPH_0004310 [Eimeria praecox]|uniref:Uncharacterized protein n=1 Tax=Eimeria praecox TaxID=51316 RepID=U6G951_9EIME|nr:hypothetical protein EPH_0004310 [Eimeria praecox]